MARDENVERRLLNWARWRSGAGDVGLGYGNASMWNQVKVDVSPNRQSVIPTNAIEASQTDDAIKDLPIFLRATVLEVYLADDSVEAKARRLGCGVSTVHSRITEAHRLISIWFHDKASTAQALRDVNAKLSAAAEASSRQAKERAANAIDVLKALSSAKVGLKK